MTSEDYIAAVTQLGIIVLTSEGNLIAVTLEGIITG